MYYKITDKESDVFKRCHGLCVKIDLIDKESKSKVEEFAGFKIDQEFGNRGFYLTFRSKGFIPAVNSLIDDGWKKDKKMHSVFVPNLRTKRGREVDKFLNNMDSIDYRSIYGAVGIERNRFVSKFKIPSIWGDDNLILIYLDDQYDPQVDGLIEVTRTEFLKLHAEL